MAIYIPLLLTAFCLAVMFRVDADQYVVFAQFTEFHEGQDLACSSTHNEVILRMNSPGCKCTSPTEPCRCCSIFSANNVKTEYCALVYMLDSKESFQISSTINGRKLFQTNVTEEGHLCAGLGNFGEVCLQFHDINIEDSKICFKMQINFLIMKQIVFLGCFDGRISSIEEKFLCLP